MQKKTAPLGLSFWYMDDFLNDSMEDVLEQKHVSDGAAGN